MLERDTTGSSQPISEDEKKYGFEVITSLLKLFLQVPITDISLEKQTPFKIISHYVTLIPTNTKRYHKNCIDVLPHMWYGCETKRVHTSKAFVDIILKYQNNYWCMACQKPLFNIQKHSIKRYIDEW